MVVLIRTTVEEVKEYFLANLIIWQFNCSFDVYFIFISVVSLNWLEADDGICHCLLERILFRSSWKLIRSWGLAGKVESIMKTRRRKQSVYGYKKRHKQTETNKRKPKKCKIVQFWLCQNSKLRGFWLNWYMWKRTFCYWRPSVGPLKNWGVRKAAYTRLNFQCISEEIPLYLVVVCFAKLLLHFDDALCPRGGGRGASTPYNGL